jgi:hypothetical protein
MNGNKMRDAGEPVLSGWSYTATGPGGYINTYATNGSGQIVLSGLTPGSYTVTVSNAAGSVTSAAALLTVNSPPQITVQPQSQTVLAGTNVVLGVRVTGSPPFTYQWRFNGADLADQTGSVLSPPVTVALTLRRGDFSVAKRYRFSQSNYDVEYSVAFEKTGSLYKNITYLDLSAELAQLVSGRL